jgi:hypothetical protein
MGVLQSLLEALSMAFGILWTLILGMMNMGDMMGRCMEAISSMTGDGIMLVVLPALIFSG